MFTLINNWMIWKNSVKLYYLKKQDFYSHLNMEDIKKLVKILKIKNFAENHDLHVQSDTLLLADACENFRNMCLEIYELDPACFFTSLGLAWQAALKKTKVKLDPLTDIDMLIMVGKRIRAGIRNSIHRYMKANNKYMKNYDKNNESLYLKYWDKNNLYGWAVSQKLH